MNDIDFLLEEVMILFLPANHFAKYICDFCERTKTDLIGLSEVTQIPKGYLMLYLKKGTTPQLVQFIKLADGMSQIAKCSPQKMISRLYAAIKKDLRKEPFPPKERTLNE